MHRFGLVLAGVAALLGSAAVASSGGGTQAAARWVMTDLTKLGVPQPMTPQDVNDRGQVLLNGKGGKAFIWQRGKLRALWRGEHGDAYAINDRGQVVGTFFKKRPYREEAFLWEKGEIRIIFSRRGAWAWANGINDRGVVVGEVFPAGNVGSYPFLWRHGRRVTNLGELPGASFSGASAINNRGQVVGHSDTKVGGERRRHAFLWQNGAMLDLSLRPDGENRAFAINERGQIVGWRGRWVATLWEGGESIRLRLFPSGRQSVAYDISDEGTIVGKSDLTSLTSPTYWHAAVWQEKQIRSLCPIRLQDSFAYGISDRGTMIVGSCGDRPVLWTLKRG